MKTQWLAGWLPCTAAALSHSSRPSGQSKPLPSCIPKLSSHTPSRTWKDIRETMLTWRTEMKHVQPFFWRLLTRPLDAVGGCLPRNGQCWEETRPAGVLSLLDRGSADPATSSQSENSTSVHVSGHISCPGKYTLEKSHTSATTAIMHLFREMKI